MVSLIVDRSQEAMAAICGETSRISAERWGEGLRAVVLTGSLARDEATLIEDGEKWMLLGDADFFLLFHDKAPLPSASMVKSARHEIENVLRQKGFVASVGLGPVRSSYFRNLPPHILSYELRCCGRVVWGDSETLSLIPVFPTEQISREDAWRLLANRMIELLEAVVSTTGPDDLRSREVQYRTIKLYLDMATSYLVFAGHYLPTYRQREQALRHLADNACASVDAPFPLRPFADTVSDCTKFKLEGRATAETPEELWKGAVRSARLLWRWELMRLTGETRPLSDHELMLRWMEHQPVTARIRGWASLLRRCGWDRSWRQWSRWIRLGRQAQPRYWVYAAAAEVFFRLPELIGFSTDGETLEQSSAPVAARLPLDRLFRDGEVVPWRRHAACIAWNYHRFLEGTRA